jgi:phenylacetate-CoA ligase
MDINQLFFKHGVYRSVVWLRGQRVFRHLEFLNKSQYWSDDRLAELQLKKLKHLLAYARASVPFYQEAFFGIPDSAIAELRDIRKLSFTTKVDLKTRHHSMVTRERLRGLTNKTTGGSTGEPVTIPKTRDAMAWELAATWRGYSWAGIEIGSRQGRLWGVPFGARDRMRAILIDFVANRRRCSAFSFGEKELEAYTRKLERFRPHYLYGYVSMLEEYAKFFQRKGSRPPFALTGIVSTSEVLMDYHRRLLEEVFGTKVYNEYGSGELGSVAHECEHGSMHVSAENMIVEVMDAARICEEDEVGELVITELNNFAAPLIRYRTGDFASWSSKKCRCGRAMPVIENLHGRAYDTLASKDGRRFHGEFVMYIFEEAQRRGFGVQGFQVVQTDLQRFLVRIVPGSDYNAQTEEFIRGYFVERFDPEVVLTFEHVTRIERAASGKMRLIVGMQGGRDQTNR